MKDISKRIKELREEKKLSQSELAEKLFVTHQTVSNWETKKTRPDIETLEAMSKVFEIDIMEFLYGNEKDEAEHKRKLMWIYIFGGCTALALILQIFAMPYLKDYVAHYYRFEWYLLTGFIMCLLYSSTAPLVFSLLSLNSDIYIKKASVRKILLGIGIFLAAVYFVSFLSFFLTVLGIELWGIPYRLANFIIYSTKAYYFIAVGALLYLGIKKGKQG